MASRSDATSSTRAINDPEIIVRIAEIGAQAAGSTPGELQAYIASETAKWKAVIDRAGITPQ